MSNGTLVLRIAVAAVLGGIVGIERELKDQPAGFRTHMLVSMGACLFTLVGAFGFQAFTGGPGIHRIPADPTRGGDEGVFATGFPGGGPLLGHGGTAPRGTTAGRIGRTAAG